MVKRLYVDMDGTLARFYEQAFCIEKMHETGFFRELSPYSNAVGAIKQIITSHNEEVEVCILSAAGNEQIIKDKIDWLMKHFQIPVTCYFCELGENKAEYIQRVTGEDLSEHDFLLDDYSANLIDWENHGGTGIKFRNELNGRGWNGHGFKGHTVYHDSDPEALATDILEIVSTGRCMEEVSRESLKYEIEKIMQKRVGWVFNGNEWECELFANYDDRISDHSLKEIFSSDDPETKFYELMGEWYDDEDYETRDEISGKVRVELGKLGGAYATDEDGNFLDDEVEELYQEVFDSGYFYCSLPFDHYLKQEVYANIMIDTGDGNRDFTDNCIYPFYDAKEDDEIRDTASLVWLAKTQGYSKEDLRKGLAAYIDGDDQTGFMNTVGQELINATSHMNVLTFLVKTTLRDLFNIAEAMLSFTNGTPKESCVVLRKDTMCGLFDPWYGAGSLLEIELQNDVVIPVSIIRSAKPDGCDGSCSISEVYGMCGSAWKSTLVGISQSTEAA